MYSFFKAKIGTHGIKDNLNNAQISPVILSFIKGMVFIMRSVLLIHLALVMLSTQEILNVPSLPFEVSSFTTYSIILLSSMLLTIPRFQLKLAFIAIRTKRKARSYISQLSLISTIGSIGKIASIAGTLQCMHVVLHSHFSGFIQLHFSAISYACLKPALYTLILSSMCFLFLSKATI